MAMNDLDPINQALAGFDQLTGDWSLEYLARQEAERKREKEALALAAEREAATQNEQTLMQAQQDGMDAASKTASKASDPMAGWDEALPGVYKQVKDGKTSYTNVVDAVGIPTMTGIAGLGGVRQTQTAPRVVDDSTGNATDFNFQAKLSQIESEKDPRNKLKAFFDLQAATAEQTATFSKQALEQAGAKLGLAEAEALLAQNEAADRADPMWVVMQSDSPMTAKQRGVVDRIRSQASVEANTYLKTNSRLSGMNAKLESMAKLLDYDLRQADRLAMQEDRQKETATLRAEQRAYQREKDLLELSPNMKARLIALDPSLASKPEGPERDAAIADYYGAVKTNPDIKGVILAPTEALLQAAVLEKNDNAERIIAMEELAKNPSTNMAEVRSQIAKMKTLVSDDTLMANALLQQVGGRKDDPTYTNFVANATAKNSGVATTAQLKGFEEQKYNFARRLLQNQAVGKFVSDVSSWGVSDPALEAAIQSAKQTTGSASFDEVAAAYIGNSVGPDRAAKSETLRRAMYQAADVRSGSFIANVNPEVVWNQWLLSKARVSLAQRLGLAGDAAAREAVQTFAKFGPSPLQLALLPAVAFSNITGNPTNADLSSLR